MFDRIAGYYDLLNHLLSLGIDIWWRKKAIAILKKDRPRVILDIATGTGDLAIAAMALDPEKVIGIDISGEMIQIGRKKVAKRKLDRVISLQEGDSENLVFEDNKFDAATVAFGVRNFEELKKGLREIHRVLKPGGKFVVLEFSKPTKTPLKQLFNFYFKHLLPTIGRLISNDSRAYSYLPESVLAFPEGENFTTILRDSGFKATEYKPLTFGICTIYSGIK